jgi:4'-phosphopantetheinyl transferase
MIVPSLSPNVVHVWTIVRDREADLATMFACLPEEEQARANRLRVSERRESFIYHRASLRRILASYTGIDPSDVRLKTSEQGKPLWQQSDDCPPLAFNLTHCGERAFLAVTAARTVGIDCEVLDPRTNYQAIARQALSPRELAVVQRLPETEQSVAVIRAWTCKEAYLKAVGVGFARPLCTIEVDWTAPDVPVLLDTGSDTDSPGDWGLLAWSPHPDCFVALAAPKECVPQRVLFLNAASLGDRSASRRDQAASELSPVAGALS